MKIINALAVPLVAAVQALVIPSPKGPFVTRWESLELVDDNRLDPFNASHTRRIMISRFSPIPEARCKKLCRVPYMSTEVAAIEDAILDAFVGDVGWPSGLLGSLELEVCCEVDKSYQQTGGHKFPTLFFGTGLNTTRLSYSATVQHVASKGYEVVIMDHPYETDVVQFPDGQIIFGGRVPADPNNTVALEFGLDARTADISFVLDTLGIHRTNYIGQSFGGAGVAAAMLNESRVISGVNLDGAMWGPAVARGVSRPFLVWGSDGHNSSSELTWTNFFNAMDEKHAEVWTKELSMTHSGHGSFTDFSLIGDVTGLRDNEALLEFFGNVTGARAMEVLKEYISDFVEFTLGDEDDCLLAGPSKEHPDVTFLR